MLDSLGRACQRLCGFRPPPVSGRSHSERSSATPLAEIGRVPRRDRFTSGSRSVEFRVEIGSLPARDRSGSAPRSVQAGGRGRCSPPATGTHAPPGTRLGHDGARETTGSLSRTMSPIEATDHAPASCPRRRHPRTHCGRAGRKAPHSRPAPAGVSAASQSPAPTGREVAASTLATEPISTRK